MVVVNILLTCDTRFFQVQKEPDEPKPFVNVDGFKTCPVWSKAGQRHKWSRNDTVQEESYILHGNLQDLKPTKPDVVRMYVSYTDPDMQAEKKQLINQVYPRLEEKCMKKYGLKFEVG